MTNKASIEQYRESADYIRARIGGETPEIAVVLGSGLGAFAGTLSDRTVIPYSEIPNFPRPTVDIQAGEMVIGNACGKRLLVMSGRFHCYEGYEMWQTAYPVGVMKLLGIGSLILTNAVGGVDESYCRGDLVCVRDHIKLCLDSPARGANIPEFGERFFDMQSVYDEKYAETAHAVAASLGIDLKDGVYGYMAGPQYETRAEVRALRLLGATVVGMSTVGEVILAAQCGIRVLCISCVSNMASGVTGAQLTTEEVVQTGAENSRRFTALLEGVLQKM